ncbi:Similar to Cryptic loci regulator 2; acc. no. O13881 [Pyronema omphalodes CBS 100304]|uniref:Similar to Cryptic loci regulator 2 acc. no. O13881 n=1 Tax=Pyronema omphalodes (strain CBS 100304) TaxID=1076935 RepID=U4KU13_PYROM|nr:Similar to Cryptic loci regulator 2; acc. no. O13881 [Pyronema omphalodes CBS 100304]
MSHGSYEEIQISFSDGDVSRHPTNTTKPEPKADGSYDYFEPLGEDSSKGVLYRQKCAAGVIVDYLPAGTEGRQFMFKTLPAGYALFEHVKVNGSNIRKDTYLFGHPNGGRFRSPAEFIPHVKYLAANSPENAHAATPADKICTCKLCGVGGRSGTPIRASGPVSRGKAIPLRAAHPEAARREVAKEERLGERETLGYIFRKGEVVWIWCGKEEFLYSTTKGDTSLWAAAVIVDRPSATAQLLPETPLNTSFDDIVAGNTPWVESLKNCLYTVHLCNSENPEEPGKPISNIPQHFLRPWLARIDDATGEHPSIPRAKEIVKTFNLFDHAFRGILGRWYEPEAVAHWSRPGATEESKLARTEIVRMTENRKQALGWKSIKGIEFMKDEDRREFRKALLANKMKDIAVGGQATPTPSWNPVNASPAKTPIKTSAMAMAVADDLADDEEDEEPAGKRLRVDEAT